MIAAALVWALLAALIVSAAAIVPFLRTRRLRTVFVSYRRSDTAKETGEVVKRLARRFGSGRVFMDVHSIRPGADFRQTIDRTLRQCDAAVVMIGPTWLSCTDETGARRLDQAGDFVRYEVAAALDSGALVMPVLVAGAPVLQPNDLPAAIRRLPDLQTLVLDGERIDESLAPALAAIAAAPVRRTPLLVTISHAAVVTLLVVAWWRNGLLTEEFVTAFGITSPMLVASGSVAIAYQLGRTPNAARVRQVPVQALLTPMAFVAAIGALVVLKTLNAGVASFETFAYWLIAIELAFSAYSGVVIASLFENRRYQ